MPSAVSRMLRLYWSQSCFDCLAGRGAATLLLLTLLLCLSAVGMAEGTGRDMHLRGVVVRASQTAHTEAPVPDAIVVLCLGAPATSEIAGCNALASTVSDASGNFELFAETSSAAGTRYFVRAGAPGDVWTSLVLDANPAQWPSSLKLIVGAGPSERERLARESQRIKDQIATLVTEASQARAGSAALRLKQVDQVRQEADVKARLAMQAGDRSALSAQLETIQKKQSQTREELDGLGRQQTQMQQQQEKLNIDLGQIFKEQQEEKRRSGASTHQVFFGTDRAVSKSADVIQVLNVPSASSGVTLGVCEVAVEQPSAGAVPGQHLLPNTDADRFYSVQSIRTLTSGELWKQAGSALQSVSSHDALLFIHGYRTSFNDACRRAAQIAYDLKFSGPVFLWSWPSRDELSGYFADEKMSSWSSGHFTAFLKQLLAQRGLHRLHIVAHSMGNRVLEQALISPDLTAVEEAHLGQIVFAAPDLSRAAFDTECNPGRISALRLTLYASRHDQALRAAKVAHPFPRLGDANPDIDIRLGMDSVDASAVDTSLIGHSYIGNSRSVLADVAALISSNSAPEKRSGLSRMGKSPREWWQMNP